MYNRPFTTALRRNKPRRRGTARLFVLGAAFAASTAAGGGLGARVQAASGLAGDPQTGDDTAQRPDAPMAFAIPPAPLAEVLTAFEQTTRVRVVLGDPGMAGIQSPGVAGTMTVRQALAALLAGTSIGFRLTAGNAVILGVRAAGEFVAVTGERAGPTSPRFTEPLRDIPQTITVVPASVIEAQGATTLRDVLRNVTGISIQAGEGGVPAGDNLSIRGFNARTDFFIDGVRDVGGYSRDPFNVEQVEVIKGPSSSIAGRGSTGGVINMATKSPHLAASRHLSVGIGSSDYKRGTLDVNQPLGSIDGRAKDNRQLPADHPTSRQLGGAILAALQRNPLFISAALPLRVFPPLFNRYEGGQSFGNHVDNAIRQLPGGGMRIRTDLSATLFLSAPEDYDGGELMVEDTYGVHSVKLPAGHLVLYPSTSLHNVRPVTRGVRVASFFWIQSMVRDDGARTLLFDLDSAIQRVADETPESVAPVQLMAVYHNLLRRWADL